MTSMDARGPSGTRKRAGVATWALLGCFIVALVLTLHNNAAEFGNAVEKLAAWRFVCSFLAALGAAICLYQSWRVTLGCTGLHLANRQALAIYAVAQLGKYAPGAIWPLVAQVRLGRMAGVGGPSIAAAGLVALGISVAVSLAQGLALLPFARALPRTHVILSAVSVVALLFVLTPPVLNACTRWAAHLLGQTFALPLLTWRGVFLASVWCLVGNAAFGIHLALLTDWQANSVDLVIVSACGFALAAGIGVLAVPVPAGAGVRELILVWALSPAAGIGGALVAALASRLVLVVVDVCLASSQIRRVMRADLRG